MRLLDSIISVVSILFSFSAYFICAGNRNVVMRMVKRAFYVLDICSRVSIMACNCE